MMPAAFDRPIPSLYSHLRIQRRSHNVNIGPHLFQISVLFSGHACQGSKGPLVQGALLAMLEVQTCSLLWGPEQVWYYGFPRLHQSSPSLTPLLCCLYTVSLSVLVDGYRQSRTSRSKIITSIHARLLEIFANLDDRQSCLLSCVASRRKMRHFCRFTMGKFISHWNLYRVASFRLELGLEDHA